MRLGRHAPTTTRPAHPLPLPAAAWRIDDYLNEEAEEDDEDLDLSSLRRHK